MSWIVDEETYKITMTKGDTTTFTVGYMMKDPETGELFEYEPQDNDKFIFAVKKKGSDEYLFCIDIPKDTMRVKFKESHTKNLELGKYMWEVSFNRYFGETDEEGYHEHDEDIHDTFIDQKILQLTEEVY